MLLSILSTLPGLPRSAASILMNLYTLIFFSLKAVIYSICCDLHMLFCSIQPWNERLHVAQERGTLVLLENLDPSYTSAEVEVHTMDL